MLTIVIRVLLIELVFIVEVEELSRYLGKDFRKSVVDPTAINMIDIKSTGIRTEWICTTDLINVSIFNGN